MENFWNIINNNVDNKNTPRDLVQEQCDKLTEITGGKIIARIAEYEGEYKSYKRPSKLSLMSSALNGISEETFNVQMKLGESGECGTFVYELFLTSEKTPKYKYRICFLYYGALIYPVGVSLEESIAEELGIDSEFDIPNEEKFIEMLGNILGSEKLTEILSNLITINN